VLLSFKFRSIDEELAPLTKLLSSDAKDTAALPTYRFGSFRHRPVDVG
jgi:hypothetical protein